MMRKRNWMCADVANPSIFQKRLERWASSKRLVVQLVVMRKRKLCANVANHRYLRRYTDARVASAYSRISKPTTSTIPRLWSENLMIALNMNVIYFKAAYPDCSAIAPPTATDSPTSSPVSIPTRKSLAAPVSTKRRSNILSRPSINR